MLGGERHLRGTLLGGQAAGLADGKFWSVLWEVLGEASAGQPSWTVGEETPGQSALRHSWATQSIPVQTRETESYNKALRK